MLPHEEVVRKFLHGEGRSLQDFLLELSRAVLFRLAGLDGRRNVALLLYLERYAVEQPVQERDHPRFLVKVTALEYVLEGPHQYSDLHAHFPEVIRCLDGLHGGLDDFHVLLVPVGLFGPGFDALLFIVEFLDVLSDGWLSLLRQYLRNDLDEGHLELIRDGFENSLDVSPVMNFADHSFLGHGVLQLLEKLSDRAGPHVEVVVEDVDLSLAEL